MPSEQCNIRLKRGTRQQSRETQIHRGYHFHRSSHSARHGSLQECATKLAYCASPSLQQIHCFFDLLIFPSCFDCSFGLSLCVGGTESLHTRSNLLFDARAVLLGRVRRAVAQKITPKHQEHRLFRWEDCDISALSSYGRSVFYLVTHVSLSRMSHAQPHAAAQ